MKKIAFFAALIMSFSAFADSYADMSSYKPGGSTAWFFSLYGESHATKKKGEEVEAGILAEMEKAPLDTEAFRLACEILKPIAGDKSVPVLKKFLKDPKYCAPACDVLLAVNSSDAADALESSLDGADTGCAMSIISTLASMGKGGDAIAKIAKGGDKALAPFAVVALGRLGTNDACASLGEIVEAGGEYKAAAIEALSNLAWRAFLSGKVPLAKRALKFVPDDYVGAVVVRGEISKDRQAYFDSVIIAGGPAVEPAARAMNKGRDFEKSAKLMQAFPKLSKESKLAAIGSFMETGDVRYYPVIAPELASEDDDILAEAIYAARFICADKEALRSILEIYRSGHKPYSDLALLVLEENPSMQISQLLKENDGDIDVLKILVKRGDIDARSALWKKFFTKDGWKDKKISSAVEKTIAYGELPAFASNFKKVKDEGLRGEMMKIIAKKLASSRDKNFMKTASKEIFKDNISKEDKLYIDTMSKLGILEKQVWQKGYGNAVDDRLMKVSTAKEPKRDSSFVSLFDGKTLDGWKTSTGNAKYSVEDGCILGVTDPEMKQNSFLITERDDFKDFIFTCEFKWVEHGNSGIMFRGQRKNNGKGDVHGPQCEIDNSKRAWTAGLYHEGGPWKYSVSREDHEAARNAVKLNDWNRLTIYCKGDKIRTWLNGVPVVDYDWGEFKQGFFGLQIHAGKKCKVLWRDIYVKELK